jgi:hypothetical protein
LFLAHVLQTWFLKTPEQELERAAKLEAQGVKYREHFWQILRLPKPKHVKEREAAIKKDASSASGLGSKDNATRATVVPIQA